MKAFLSHSSKDKVLVDAVAKHLGRQFCRYDKYHFETGEEFQHAIRRCLDESTLFVLFASRKALSSFWVKFESDEAWNRKLRDQISKSLVYIIEDDLEISELPDWLQRALIRRNSAAKSIARDIRAELDHLLRERRQPYFVGRSANIHKVEQVLTPTDGSNPPRIFVVSGLPGVGRRALIQHSVPNILGFQKFVELRVEEGDSINDICAKTADLIEPYSSQKEFMEIFTEIKSLDEDKALDRSLTNLRAFVDGNELPILIDCGGLLDSEGYYCGPTTGILRGIGPQDETYLALISHRRPQRNQEFDAPVVQVDPLESGDTKRLVQRLFGARGIKIEPSDLTEIAEFTAGYPPSAYFAAQQAEDYGVKLVVSHKQRLVEFRTGVFLKHIDSLGLETHEGSILQLLAAYSPLPVAVIMEALEIDLDQADDSLVRLIDLSLVIPDSDGLYRIADPIREAATSTYGLLDRKIVEPLVVKLASYLNLDIPISQRLELNRVLFRASRFADIKVSGDIARLSADMVRLTEDYYHAREYLKSVECGIVAIDERPDSVNARSYLIRSLVQLERWQEAEVQIQALAKYAPGRDVHFLRGFMERRRSRYRDAIREYKVALDLGRRGAAIGRELAQCYFLIGDFENASASLQDVLERHGDNRYVVDLWVQISTEMGDLDEAQKALSRLEILDKREFFLYRKSRVEWRFGRVTEALEAIREALAISGRPTFAFLAQGVLCEIGSNNYSEAERLLAKLDTQYGDIRRDVRVSLRCRLLNALGKYEEALQLSERISDRETQYFKALRVETLTGLLSNEELDQKTREHYEAERDQLEGAVGQRATFDFSDFD